MGAKAKPTAHTNLDSPEHQSRANVTEKESGHAAAAINLREASMADLDELIRLETLCFAKDQLSRRSFKRWISVQHGSLLVAEKEQRLIGYGLLWCHKGTRLARLYSLAVDPEMRGLGIANQLIDALENVARENKRIYMRLEVAKKNTAAIAFYRKNGYSVFGEYYDYYEDHDDALRMQKRILHLSANALQRQIPWYQQTTEFTCGPASLMMAMASLNNKVSLTQTDELAIWREATTIFMTSGHGGCHPIGLALAAKDRGFKVSVYLNSDAVLFIDSVRNEHKREILNIVHEDFVARAQQSEIPVIHTEITQTDIQDWLNADKAVLILISTYRLDGKKAPHWVCISGMDDNCFYVHDPDPDENENEQSSLDCQYLPIARSDFDLMSAFGAGRLRTAVVLEQGSKA
ncbi:Mycothiol acetyltransferase [Thalassocella blandensis]|nr:Mycothiol acetyltransferase [Thalassocella blandensis]